MKSCAYILLTCITFLFSCKSETPKTEKEVMQEKYDSYIKDVKDFDLMMADFANITDLKSMNISVKKVRERFKGVTNADISRKFDRIHLTAFSHFIAKIPQKIEAQKECYEMRDMDLDIRKYCLLSSMKHYLRLKDYESAKSLSESIPKDLRTKLTTEEKNAYSVAAEFNNTHKKYKSAKTYSDQSLYDYALEMKPICDYFWKTQYGCPNYQMMNVLLQNLIKNSPDSDLADDAAVVIAENSNCLTGSGKEIGIIDLKIDYDKILKKYPNTDLKASIQKKISELELMDSK